MNSNVLNALNMILFLNNLKDQAVNGIVPFSKVTKHNYRDNYLMYDDENPILDKYGHNMYPLISEFDIESHKIDEYYDLIDIDVYVKVFHGEEPAVHVHFHSDSEDEAGYAVDIFESGRMDSGFDSHPNVTQWNKFDDNDSDDSDYYDDMADEVFDED